MDYRINQTVQTPLGVGQFMANYAVLDGNGVPVVKGRMVQVKLTDTTRCHIKDSNCLTPLATSTALFVFQDDELQEAKAAKKQMYFALSERGASLIDCALILAAIIVIAFWAFHKSPL